jgi:hypothetical protein
MKTDKTQMPEHSNDGVGRLNKLAYRDGYIHGTNLDDYIQQENSSLSSNIGEKNRLPQGLLLGLTLTTLIGLIGGTSFLWTYHYLQSTTPVRTEHVPTK